MNLGQRFSDAFNKTMNRNDEREFLPAALEVI